MRKSFFRGLGFRRPPRLRYQLQLMIEVTGRHGLLRRALSNTEAVDLSYHEEFRGFTPAQYPTYNAW